MRITSAPGFGIKRSSNPVVVIPPIVSSGRFKFSSAGGYGVRRRRVDNAASTFNSNGIGTTSFDSE